MCEPKTGDGTWYGRGPIPRGRGCGFAAVRREVHVERRGFRGYAAKVDHRHFLLIGQIRGHETVAAKISGARQGHGQSKGDPHGGIDRIAAAREDPRADGARRFVLRHDHAVEPDAGRMDARVFEKRLLLRLRNVDGAEAGEQRESQGEDQI